MLPLFRYLFGNATSSVRSSTIAVARPAGEAAPGGALLDDSTSLSVELHTRFLKSLRQVENELISDDPITADLKLLVTTLRDQPIERIRQLPVAAQRALALLHGDATTKELVELFQQDPSISQALLQQVNSTYYNPSGARVVSLPDAISRIGRAGVECVVMQQSVSGMISRPGGNLDVMVQQVWNHMVRVAPLARCFAPAFNASPDQAFLGGLLHDVGKLAVFDRITELRSRHRRTLVLERRKVGRALVVLHESLGGLIIDRWGLGIDVARGVALHHRDSRPIQRDVLSEVVHLAERIDIARELKQTVDLPAIWESAALTGSIDAATQALARATESNPS
jgi:HD-like signal output (HDOD) protein